MVSDMAKWKRSQVRLWGQGKLVSAYYASAAARSGLGTAHEVEQVWASNGKLIDLCFKAEESLPVCRKTTWQ